MDVEEFFESEDSDPGTEPSDSEEKDRERELTNRYLSGEITFAEYTVLWLGNDVSDESLVTTDLNAASNEEDQIAAEEQPLRKKPRSQLTASLKGLMGEANLRFVRGERELAEKICNEIICQVPAASEPYELLSQIYEHNEEKSLQFLFLSAHLNPSCDELWLNLADISKKRGDIKQEMLCYNRAIEANKTNLGYHMRRIDALKAYEQSGFPIQTLKLSFARCYLQLIKFADPIEPTLLLQLAKEAASIYYNDKDYYNALLAMNIAFYKVFSLFTNEDVNLYLDLMIILKKYNTCLEVLVSKCDVELEADIETISEDGCIKEQTNVISCHLPDLLPVDIFTKLLVCLIHMNSMPLAAVLIEKLFANDVEDAGDLYLDVEEALTAHGHHELALRTLEPLVRSQRFSLPAVWLKYAECLTALNRLDEAIQSFETVVQLAPQHIGARLKLYEIYTNRENLHEALRSLEQDDTTTLLDTGLLYLRCELLKSMQQYTDYLKVGRLLLYRHFPKLRNKSEIQTFRVRVDCLHAVRISRGEIPEDDTAPAFDADSHKLTMQQEWDLFTDLYMTAKSCKRYAYMTRLSFEAIGSKLFVKNRAEIEFMALIACIYNDEYYYAYNLVRELFWQKSNRDKDRFYNLLNLVIHGCEDTRYQKFIVRLHKRIENVPLTLLRTNNLLCSGLHREALSSLLKEYKKRQTPATCLLLGLTMLFRSCQSFMPKEFKFILQAMALLEQYKELRGVDAAQEVNYNIGRAYHMLGIFNLAIAHYQKVLDSTPIHCPDHPNALDLKYEAAYNLHCIYRNTSPALALMYLEKYMVI